MVSATMKNSIKVSIKGLNPYYTGRWFLLCSTNVSKLNYNSCLNPYYTGRWFLLLCNVSVVFKLKKS